MFVIIGKENRLLYQYKPLKSSKQEIPRVRPQLKQTE